MDAASPPEAGLLAVVGLPADLIAALCERHGVEVAIHNDDDHHILGGLQPALQAAAAAAQERGARVQSLAVTVPAHTHWLQRAAHDFEQVLCAAPIRRPEHLLLAGCDALPVDSRERVITTLARQIDHGLQWHAAMQQAVERGARIFLELGPGTALARIARTAFPQLEARSVDDFQTLDGIAEWVECACARAH
jgi:[acyl-carrier-protein] S-malonyltransferase